MGASVGQSLKSDRSNLRPAHAHGIGSTILLRRKAYYAALEAANKSNEVTAWVCWFAGIAIEAQRRTTAHVEFLLENTRLLDRLRVELNPRQEKALLRMFQEGPDEFKGGLSAGKAPQQYRASVGCP
jgi:Fic family protein